MVAPVAPVASALRSRHQQGRPITELQKLLPYGVFMITYYTIWFSVSCIHIFVMHDVKTFRWYIRDLILSVLSVVFCMVVFQGLKSFEIYIGESLKKKAMYKCG